MAHYLLFVPGPIEPSRHLLDGLGLHALCESAPPQFYPLAGDGGPDGQPGQLCLLYECPDINHQDRNPVPAYQPDRQEWRPHPDGLYWVGWERSRPPRPEDLARSSMLEGPSLTMGDGQLWQLPNAFDQEARLALGPGGALTRRSVYLHSDLYQQASEMLDATAKQLLFQAGKDGGEPWDIGRVWQFVCGLLARNYRLNEFIIGELGLIVENRLAVCVAVVTDLVRLQRLEREIAQGN